MNEQEKAVLGLGVYTALADGEADQAEISFISGVAREVLGGEDEDEFISIISGLLEAHGKAVEAGAVGSLISEEAEKLTDESWRLLALKFCMHIARQDGEFEEVEGHTIGRVMGTWASMGDGWDYSAKEAIDLAMAEDETDDGGQTADTGTEAKDMFIEPTGNLLTDLFGTENLISKVEQFKTFLNQSNQVPFVHFDGENDLENRLYVFRSSGQKSTFKQIYDELDYPFNRGPIFYLSKCVVNYSFRTFIIFVQDGWISEDPNNEGAVTLFSWDMWGEVIFVKHRDLDAPVILLAHPTNAPELNISPELSLQPSYTDQDLAFMNFGYSVLERYWETVEANREKPTNEIPLGLFYILNEGSIDFLDDGQAEDENDDDGQTVEMKDGLVEEFHENGQLSLRENYKNGKRNGLRERFHENGQLMIRGNCKGDEEEGLWEYFYETGQLRTRGNFKGGDRGGPWEGFHENGQLSLRENYKDGELDGLWEEFHENGQLKLRGNYKDGEQDGLWEEFDENGQLSKRENYKDGVLQDEDDGQTEDEDKQTEEIKNGLYESFHENGQLHLRENYKDGELDGLFEVFHENGELSLRGNHKDGKMDGLVEEFHESGQLNWRGNYKDGEQEGLYEGFRENGQLQLRGTFKDGKMDGLWEGFNENGQLEEKENYKDGKKDGLRELFHENGQLSKRENYKDGVLQDPGDGQTDDTSTETTEAAPDDDVQTEEIKNGIYETFHENGQLLKKENYKDGELDGLFEVFHENGQLSLRGNHKDGVWDGLVEWFHENGQLSLRGNHKDDERDGLWESYYENGQLQSRENYKDGDENGLVEWFHENGQLESRGNYKDGERDGLMESYYETGQLESRGIYNFGNTGNNLMQGPWEFFHENGQLRSRGNYKDGERDGLMEEFNENGQLLKKENYKDGVLQDEDDGQAEDTGTETTEAAPKGKNAPVTAEPAEEVTVTLSKNHKTFKTESGDYRLERYKDGKIKAFKDDELCKNTKNVLRAINKEYKLGFTSGDFKKLHTRKLGKEIIEKMKGGVLQDPGNGQKLTKEKIAIYKANGKHVSCDYSEMFYETLGDDFQRDDSIVIVEVIGENFENFINPETETEAYKIFENLSFKEIGYADYGDWDELSSIVGKEEVGKLRKIYFDCDDYAETTWTVLLYHNFTYVTLVRD